MELKFFTSKWFKSSASAFNRTAYGIEMSK